MSCEKCWGDAHRIVYGSGESQGDVYRRLLAERVDEKMCTPEQQCGDLHLTFVGAHGQTIQCRCGLVTDKKVVRALVKRAIDKALDAKISP